MKATPRDEKSMLRCEFCNRPADEHDGHVISAGEGYSSAVKEPMSPEVKSAVNYLAVRQDGSYGLTVTSPVGDDLGIMMREKNRSIVFHFGGKRLKFTLVNGKIGAEYNPDDLAAAAQTVVSEVERLLGVGCGADRSDDVRGDR